DGVIQKISVCTAHIYVKFALEFGAQGGPVALQNGAEIIVLLPVCDHRGIDLAGLLVEDRFGITVFAHRSENGLPYIKLLPRASVRAQGKLVLVHALHGGKRATEIIPHAWLCDLRVRALNIESVLVVVQIDGGVGAKVHRIGTGDERAVIVVRIKLLDGHGFPTARGTAIDEPRPALAD